ncbi:MAG: GPW/gp25 family protein [Actinobacteria bacterium]|nr:GPW/gp25 family protein [Actinomycetota bacterium]
MHIDYPHSINNQQRSATTDRSDHVRDLIEQVLFTAQGERVNRPDFGAGIERLVFAPNSDELTSSTKAIVQGALYQWLADVIVVENVETSSDEGSLVVTVVYTDLGSGDRQTETFSRDV